MSASKKIIFYHGGPGLNANPEHNLLAGFYSQNGLELCTWNEPSLLRPQHDPFREENAYARYLESAERFLVQHYTGTPLIVMAHSYGAHAAGTFLKSHVEKVAAVVLTAPGFDASKVDRNIFRLIAQDYLAHDDHERGKEMEQILAAFTGNFDENTERGWMLALENPRLFNYYWFNTEKAQAYLQHFAPPEYTVDTQSFFAVRRTSYAAPAENCDLKTLVFYGKHDRVLPDETGDIAARFPDHRTMTLEQSGHYPHIEEAERVLSAIKDFI